MKSIIFLLIIFINCFNALGQKQYRVVFKDSSNYKFENLKSMDSVVGNDLNSEITNKILEQLKENGITQTYDRIVTTHKDFTVISIDRTTISGTVEINGNTDIFDSLLLKDGELFFDSLTESGFASAPVSSTPKTFRLTGKQRTILNHNCKEYLSTDSLCTIWTTTDLPASINPGVRLTSIRTAILGFELRTEGNVLRSVASKIE